MENLLQKYFFQVRLNEILKICISADVKTDVKQQEIKELSVIKYSPTVNQFCCKLFSSDTMTDNEI